MTAIISEKNDKNFVPWRGHCRGDKKDRLCAQMPELTYSVLLFLETDRKDSLASWG